MSVQLHRIALALEERAMVAEVDPRWRVAIVHDLAQLRIELEQGTIQEADRAAALVREALATLGLKYDTKAGRWAQE